MRYDDDTECHDNYCLTQLDIVHQAFKQAGYITETRQLKVGGLVSRVDNQAHTSLVALYNSKYKPSPLPPPRAIFVQ